MKLIHRKNRWQRLLEPVAGATPSGGALRSGLVAAGAMVGLSVASAVVSAVRHSGDDR